MTNANSRSTPTRIPVQPTSFGNPPIISNYRFYQFAARLLVSLNRFVRIAVIASIILSLSLIIYVAFVVKHTTIYASDGSFFSCVVGIKDK